MEGEVEISGAKNSAAPLISASLVSQNKVVLANLPCVSDVIGLLEIIKKAGGKVEREDKVVKIERDGFSPEKIDKDLVNRMRASVLLLAPLVVGHTVFSFPSPGGDRIGVRPIMCHLDALSQLGVEWRREGSWYFFKRKELFPSTIYLSELSVTATELMLIILSTIEGESRLVGGATEPHVQNLVEFLRKLGAEIRITPDHVYIVRGKKELGTYMVEHSVEPDHIELGTFMVAGALAGKEVFIKAQNLGRLDYMLSFFKRAGVVFEKTREGLMVRGTPEIKPIRIQALPWPGFPTDLLPMFSLLLTQARGKSLIHDPLYEGRQTYLIELKKMGADIEVVDPHRALIFGPASLQGIEVESWDIRAGATLVLAGLIAKGQTTIWKVDQIQRGYENFDVKLKKLGAKILSADAG